MADVHTKKQRSYNMSQIRSKNIKPEMIVSSWLHKQGYHFVVTCQRSITDPKVSLYQVSA
ncbi:MAG: very short patch repair endonuclease [Ignavibacteria bacterium]|nr:very short patch repair endonuclease [Ignavibacteria bacterium]